jgi:hypothetical protein
MSGIYPPQFQTFLLNFNKPDFEVTDLPQALELAEKNGLITVAVGIYIGINSNNVLSPLLIYHLVLAVILVCSACVQGN